MWGLGWPDVIVVEVVVLLEGDGNVRSPGGKVEPMDEGLIVMKLVRPEILQWREHNIQLDHELH